ncbi:MAG: alpha/beta hydrolase family protein [Chloroflexi bacterium]|nr:alpha/beta hydrolase family protein [Chloroflexota bacterium]
MDPQVYVKRRIQETEPAMAWKPGRPEAQREWQDAVRERLRTLLGALTPADLSTPLNPKTVDRKAFRGYSRETVVFTSRPGLEVFGYFLAPENASPGKPAVLCLPGHGRGVDSIVGIAEDGSQREIDAPDEYQQDFALQCVRHGYPTLAIEQVSFGRRRDAKAREAGAGASSCTRDTMAAFMLGETMVGWRVLDAMRSLDYLAARPEVDPNRLITMGISGGGVTSLFTACMDTRVCAAVVSGYFNTFRDSILAVDHWKGSWRETRDLSRRRAFPLSLRGHPAARSGRFPPGCAAIYAFLRPAHAAAFAASARPVRSPPLAKALRDHSHRPPFGYPQHPKPQWRTPAVPGAP